MLGRFPNEREVELYSIPKDVPTWLPSGEEDLPWFENFLQMNRVQMIIGSVEIELKKM